MTAAIVLRPDFETTFVRGFGRIAGTMAGAVVATLLIALINADPWPPRAPSSSPPPRPTCRSIRTTRSSPSRSAFVAVVLHMRGLPGTTTIADRLIDTLAGGTLAMVGYLAFPSVEHERTRALLADLLDAQRHLAVAILRAYAAPSPKPAPRSKRGAPTSGRFARRSRRRSIAPPTSRTVRTPSELSARYASSARASGRSRQLSPRDGARNDAPHRARRFGRFYRCARSYDGGARRRFAPQEARAPRPASTSRTRTARNRGRRRRGRHAAAFDRAATRLRACVGAHRAPRRR